jgi:1-acyl-sn-glycerol-3-phosphate acyltransferase
MKKKIYEFIFFRLMGWKIEGTIDKEIKKCILMVVPHTSWHDFYLGIFTRGIIGLKMNFIGKKELFRFPLGSYFRWMGGEPIDRSGNQNKVEAIAKIFEKKNEFRLAIAPEGTRKKVEKLKSGFYYIALQAGIPIIPVAFNFGEKSVQIGLPNYLTGEYENDLALLVRHFEGVVGKIPKYSFGIEK